MSRRIFNLYVGGKNCGVYSVKTLVHQALSNLYPDITDLRILNKKKNEYVPATYNTVCQHLTKNENGDKYPKCLLFSNKAIVSYEKAVKESSNDLTTPEVPVKVPSPVVYIFEQEINVGPDGTKYNGTIADMDPKWMASNAEWIGEVEPAKVEEKEEAADEEVDEEEVKASEPVKEAPVAEAPVAEAPVAEAPVAIETTEAITSTPVVVPSDTPSSEGTDEI